MALTNRAVRNIVLVLNVVILLLAISMAVVSGVVLSKLEYLQQIVKQQFHIPPILLMVAGGIICVGVTISICGTLQKEHQTLIVAIILDILGGIFQVAGAIMAVGIRDDEELIDLYTLKLYELAYSKYPRRIDEIQLNFQCCGYEKMPRYINGTCPFVPASCCEDRGLVRPCQTCSSTRFQKSCSESIMDYLDYQGVMLFSFAIAIAPIEIALIHCQICLMYRYYEEYQASTETTENDEEETSF